MADQVLDFQIKVNTDTGQLTALGSEFKNTAQSAKGMGDSMQSAASQAGALFQQLLPFAGAAGILMFFKDSVQAANDQEEALRRLGFALSANGVDWNANKAEVTAWALGIQDLTRFSQTEALNALGQMSRATKDVGEAQTAVKVAMGLSVATGKDLNESLNLMQGLMMGTQRSVMMAHKELGTYVGTATTAQQMLDILTQKFKDAATSEDSYTKSTQEAGHSVDTLEKSIGGALLPALKWMADAFSSVINRTVDVMTEFSSQVLQIIEMVKGFSLVIKDTVTGNSKQAVADVKEMYRAINQIDADSKDTIAARAKDRQAADAAALKTAEALHAGHALQELNAEQTATAKFKELHATLAADLDKIGTQTVQKRLDENAQLMAAEAAKVGQIKGLSDDQTKTLLADIARLKAAKDADIKADVANAAKAAQIHDELDKKLNALGVQTLAKKKQNIDIETQLIKDKINKEIVDETAKNALLAQADAVNRAQKAALDDKAWTDYQATVSQTLKATTDAMGAAFAQQIVEGKSFSDAMKQIWTQLIEKMIEELIALIVKLVVVQALEASTGLGGAGGALLGSMGSAFGRAEGGTNIVDKPTLFLAGEAGPEIASFTPMSKVGRGDETGGNTSKMSGPGAGSGSNVVGPAGSGGGGNVYVGDIHVTLQLASLASGDRQSMLRQLADEIRGASVDAIRFAVTSQNLAQRNAQVAV